MERLTHRYRDGVAWVSLNKVYKMGKNKCVGEPISVLAAYEDTGLTPEQIQEIDRLYAEKCREVEELKAMLPPYKVGDSLWEVIRDGVVPDYVQEIIVQEVSNCRIWANDTVFDYDDIGKTVFLTRAEVEQALKKMKRRAAMSDTKLKSCPFCGKEVQIISNCIELEECENFEECTGNTLSTVVCNFKKGGCGATGGYRVTKEEAIKAWNRRASNECAAITRKDR